LARRRLNNSEIKLYARQLLEVLEHLHSRGYIHRDIKCSNLLLSRDHRLKLADFGLSRKVDDQHPLRSPKVRPTCYHALSESCSHLFCLGQVITRWYRPPELLLGEQKYGSAVDMWSVG